jgi:hypothetical protein
MKIWRLSVLSVAITAWYYTTAASETLLDIKLNTQAEEYFSGETVYFFLDACNPANQPRFETFSCKYNLFKVSIVDDRNKIVAYYDEGKECSGTPIRLKWKPNECLHLGPFTWLQTGGGFPVPGDGKQVPPGEYQVRAKWENGPEVESSVISIKEADPPSIQKFQWAGVIFVFFLAVVLSGILFYLLRRK